MLQIMYIGIDGESLFVTRLRQSAKFAAKLRPSTDVVFCGGIHASRRGGPTTERETRLALEQGEDVADKDVAFQFAAFVVREKPLVWILAPAPPFACDRPRSR